MFTAYMTFFSPGNFHNCDKAPQEGIFKVINKNIGIKLDIK